MTKWADLLDEEPEPVPLPTQDAMQSMATAMRTAVDSATALQVAARAAMGEEGYTFSGPEPPPHVVRLEFVSPRDTQEAEMHVARCPEGGWWFVRYDDWPRVPAGWLWPDGATKTKADPLLRPVYPTFDNDHSDFVESMARALPPDFVAYRIGIHDKDGTPLWGWLDSDGEWGAQFSRTSPDDD